MPFESMSFTPSRQFPQEITEALPGITDVEQRNMSMLMQAEADAAIWQNSTRVRCAMMHARAHEEIEIRRQVRNRLDELACEYRDCWPHEGITPMLTLFVTGLDATSLRHVLVRLDECLRREKLWMKAHGHERLRQAARVTFAMQWIMALIMVSRGAL